MATRGQRLAVVALLATVGLGLGACGGGDDDDKSSTADGKAADSAPAGGSGSQIGERTIPGVEVVGKEFSYNPAKLTLKAGQDVFIILKNTGSIEHDITVSDSGFKLTVAGGKTGNKMLKVDKPGTYEFHCSLSGHKDAGMKGELTVE